jgi:hypothetical protein
MVMVTVVGDSAAHVAACRRKLLKSLPETQQPNYVVTISILLGSPHLTWPQVVPSAFWRHEPRQNVYASSGITRHEEKSMELFLPSAHAAGGISGKGTSAWIASIAAARFTASSWRALAKPSNIAVCSSF